MLKPKSVLQPGWSNNLSPASRLWLNRITTWKPHHYYPSNLLQLFPYFICLEWVNATDLRCPIWPPCCAWAKFLRHASLTEQIAAPEAAWFIHSCLPIPVKRGQWSRKSTGYDAMTRPDLRIPPRHCWDCCVAPKAKRMWKVYFLLFMLITAVELD